MAEPDYESMSASELERLLDARRVRFVHELMIDGNQTAAAVRAGYSEKTAASQASRLLKDVKVSAYRRARARALFEALGYDKPQLALKLCEILDRCMDAKPHLSWDSDAKAWLPDGTWVFDSRGAVKAIEAMAKLQGLYGPGKLELRGEDGARVLRVEFTQGDDGSAD